MYYIPLQAPCIALTVDSKSYGGAGIAVPVFALLPPLTDRGLSHMDELNELHYESSSGHYLDVEIDGTSCLVTIVSPCGELLSQELIPLDVLQNIPLIELIQEVSNEHESRNNQ